MLSTTRTSGIAIAIFTACLSLVAIAQEKEKKNPPEKPSLLKSRDYEEMQRKIQRERKANLPKDHPCVSDSKCKIIDPPQRVVGGVRG